MTNASVVVHSRDLLSRGEPTPVDPTQVPLWISGVTVSQYFQVATVSVLGYDLAISIDKEAKYFWRIPRKAVDFVYFANRFVGIFGTVAFLYGHFATWTRSIAQWITIALIDYILMIRVLALYCRAKSISICLNILFVMSASSKLGIIIYGLHSQQNAVFSLGNYGTVCGVNKTPSWKLGMFDWLIPMVLYFMLIILCSMFAILGFKLVIPNVILADILSSLGNPSFLSLLGSRMLINLKEAGERGQNEGTNYKIPSMTLSDIDFAEPRNDARAMDETTRNRDILT
ncbi:hypothetical protein ACEPAF_9996 [Sanghuangporus sanghuang]